MIVTRYDEIATPYTTGLPRGRNVRNVVLQDRCATDYTEHSEMTADPIAVREILNALHPATAVPARCTTVLPFIGPIGVARPAPIEPRTLHRFGNPASVGDGLPKRGGIQ